MAINACYSHSIELWWENWILRTVLKRLHQYSLNCSWSKTLQVTIELGLVFIMATLDTNMVPAGRDFKLPFICWVVLINHVTLLETFAVILYFHRVNRDESPPFWLIKICPIQSVVKVVKPDLVKIQTSGQGHKSL